MKPANADRQASAQKRSGQIDRTRKLIGLYADQSDEGPATGSADDPDDAVGPNPPVGLVISMNADCDIGAEYLAPTGVFSQTVETR